MNWAGLGNSFQLFVAYFVLAVVVIIFAVRKAKPGWAKWAAGLGTFSVFWGLTLIDDVMGAREHKALCEKEAGVKIYKQAKLPPEFYTLDGRPKFIDSNGDIREKILARYIKVDRRENDSYSSRYLKIDRDVYSLNDAITGDALAVRVDFLRWPSSFVPSILHAGAIRCDPLHDPYPHLYKHVFPDLTAQ